MRVFLSTLLSVLMGALPGCQGNVMPQTSHVSAMDPKVLPQFDQLSRAELDSLLAVVDEDRRRYEEENWKVFRFHKAAGDTRPVEVSYESFLQDENELKHSYYYLSTGDIFLVKREPVIDEATQKVKVYLNVYHRDDVSESLASERILFDLSGGAGSAADQVAANYAVLEKLSLKARSKLEAGGLSLGSSDDIPGSAQEVLGAELAPLLISSLVSYFYLKAFFNRPRYTNSIALVFMDVIFLGVIAYAMVQTTVNAFRALDDFESAEMRRLFQLKDALGLRMNYRLSGRSRPVGSPEIGLEASSSRSVNARSLYWLIRVFKENSGFLDELRTKVSKIHGEGYTLIWQLQSSATLRGYMAVYTTNALVPPTPAVVIQTELPEDGRIDLSSEEQKEVVAQLKMILSRQFRAGVEMAHARILPETLVLADRDWLELDRDSWKDHNIFYSDAFDYVLDNIFIIKHRSRKKSLKLVIGSWSDWYRFNDPLGESVVTKDVKEKLDALIFE